MRKAENVNAPNFAGWLIGAAAGLVAIGALIVVGKFDLTPAVAVGGAVALLVGLILGMPSGTSAAPAPLKRVMPEAAAPKAEPVAAPAAMPAAFVSAPVAPSPAQDGPARLSAPKGGTADNLKEIEGIGPAMEKLVNEMGFYHFDQIANWSEADVAWVDANMRNFKGRITRDKWVAQAKIIVNEGLAAFRERAKTNNY